MLSLGDKVLARACLLNLREMHCWWRVRELSKILWFQLPNAAVFKNCQTKKSKVSAANRGGVQGLSKNIWFQLPNAAVLNNCQNVCGFNCQKRRCSRVAKHPLVSVAKRGGVQGLTTNRWFQLPNAAVFRGCQTIASLLTCVSEQKPTSSIGALASG